MAHSYHPRPSVLQAWSRSCCLLVNGGWFYHYGDTENAVQIDTLNRKFFGRRCLSGQSYTSRFSVLRHVFCYISHAIINLRLRSASNKCDGFPEMRAEIGSGRATSTSCYTKTAEHKFAWRTSNDSVPLVLSNGIIKHIDCREKTIVARAWMHFYAHFCILVMLISASNNFVTRPVVQRAF